MPFAPGQNKTIMLEAELEPGSSSLSLIRFRDHDWRSRHMIFGILEVHEEVTLKTMGAFNGGYSDA